MIGPFDNSPFPTFRISPIGVATRKYSGKKLLIIDLSAPHNGLADSINSLIPLTPFSLFYNTVDDAIKFIKKAGRGAWLAKADISDAFKIMPLHPSQWHLFGVQWRKTLYFAVRLLAVVAVQKYSILCLKLCVGFFLITRNYHSSFIF